MWRSSVMHTCPLTWSIWRNFAQKKSKLVDNSCSPTHGMILTCVKHVLLSVSNCVTNYQVKGRNNAFTEAKYQLYVANDSLLPITCFMKNTIQNTGCAKSWHSCYCCYCLPSQPLLSSVPTSQLPWLPASSRAHASISSDSNDRSCQRSKLS